MKLLPTTRRGGIRLGLVVLLPMVAVLALWYWMIRMPGDTWGGPLPDREDTALSLEQRLRAHVEMLGGTIGERNVFVLEGLRASEAYLKKSFEELGFTVDEQIYKCNGVDVRNIEVEIRGTKTPEEIVIVGGHYDSVMGSPGANDNATGTAATLELARHFKALRPGRTLRFVLFVNEEPPFFQGDEMGSLIYARRCRERNEDVVSMVSLETIGCYLDEPGSQKYPAPLSAAYPDVGNFIGFVGNTASRALVHQTIGRFRSDASFPSEGIAGPSALPGLGWSDHWSFWQAGYSGVMVTDTAPFRYPHYHTKEDTPDKVDYGRMSRVVAGLIPVIAEQAQVEMTMTETE